MRKCFQNSRFPKQSPSTIHETEEIEKYKNRQDYRRSSIYLSEKFDTLSMYDYSIGSSQDSLYNNLHTANYNAKKQVLKASYPLAIRKHNETLSEFPMSKITKDTISESPTPKKENCFSRAVDKLNNCISNSNRDKPSNSPRKTHPTKTLKIKCLRQNRE